MRVNYGDRTTLQIGEGSVLAEEIMNEVPKTCENDYGSRRKMKMSKRVWQ